MQRMRGTGEDAQWRIGGYYGMHGRDQLGTIEASDGTMTREGGKEAEMEGRGERISFYHVCASVQGSIC